MINAIKKYRLGFDIWGLVLFFTIMIPNFIWFKVPAPNDILRGESITPVFDTIASVSQVIMVMALCLIVRRNRADKMDKHFIIGTVTFTFIYFIGWIFYYKGFTNPIVILDLCIAPCLAFLIFAFGRKNIVTVIPLIIFMACHIVYGVINFIC